MSKNSGKLEWYPIVPISFLSVVMTHITFWNMELPTLVVALLHISFPGLELLIEALNLVAAVVYWLWQINTWLTLRSLLLVCDGCGFLLLLWGVSGCTSVTIIVIDFLSRLLYPYAGRQCLLPFESLLLPPWGVDFAAFRTICAGQTLPLGPRSSVLCLSRFLCLCY